MWTVASGPAVPAHPALGKQSEMVCPSIEIPAPGVPNGDRVTRGLAICRLKGRGVPNGDREDSLGLSNAMPQGTGPPIEAP